MRPARFKMGILILSLFTLAACASKEKKEDMPLQSSQSAPAGSTLSQASQDLRQSAKFSRLSDAVRFDFASTTLSSENKRILDQLAVEMNMTGNSFEKVRISGFADPIGNSERNRQISLQRAEAVRSYLISKGVPSSKLEAVGMGSEYAESSIRQSKSQMAEDRRVELEIVE